MYCRIIPKLISHKDICELSDDGNPGAFNVFTHCGKLMGCACLFLDLFKGFLPVVVASAALNTRNFCFALVMLAPVAGHAVGAFNRFKGGKCIAASFGVTFGAIAVSPWAFVILAALYVMFSTVIKIKSHTARTITVYLLFALISTVIFGLTGLAALGFGCVLISATVIIKHLCGADKDAEATNDD